MVERLSEKAKEQDKDADEIRGEYFQKDDHGKFVVGKDSKLQLLEGKKLEDVNKAFDELTDSEVIIEFTEYGKKLKALYDALVNYEYELSGSDAENYELVLTQLEKNFEGENK
ncbi:hypothetical protein FC81_GL000696 [Liquorilactobacillus capillatus DSM 19910]|uniref:Uncharacterized protein n=1 Tax=Liquorilactobacillus capillatus DSM 19910 TaxID=1423731 RepID=A0A0R1M3C6_9LACO|nr:hypothetical protein FC81_GL000696 [Liquorilactobacillus capillatus DSM 19910]